MKLLLFTLLPTTVSSLASVAFPRPSQVLGMPSSIDAIFNIVPHDQDDTCTVLSIPVQDTETELYIAIDHDQFCPQTQPGNGGLRVLDYASTTEMVQDAVRLATGMTRKHAAYHTGFGGAKLVSNAAQPHQRQALLQTTARALQALDGAVYTGCDLNTFDDDMQVLASYTDDQYVLAGMYSQVDTNVATAMTVVGSLLGMCQAHDKQLSDLVCTVQGCGKVGTIVAQELIARGAKTVQTCDLDMDRALSIAGSVPITDWSTTPCDVLIPCANSLAITEDIATHFPEGLEFCVGATNSPFAGKARDILASKGVSFVPESISSAGAILADSVEWTDRPLFRRVTPSHLYGWVRDLSRRKAALLCQQSGLQAHEMHDNVKHVMSSGTGSSSSNNDGDKTPIGEDFPTWIKDNVMHTDTLIIGGGVAGTATARSLSKLGRDSILVEQGATLAPDTASSNGDSRMYRQLYSDPFFSQMQTDALECWKEVQEETGTTLLHPNGLLFYGEDTGETVEGSVAGARDTMEQLGLPHTFYESGDALANAFPALEGCRGQPYTGVYEETAGHVRASAACAAMAQAAGNDCTVQTHTKIVNLDLDDDKVQAVTSEGTTILADQVVMCAGAWTNELLQMADLPELDLELWRIQWAHYKVDDPEVAKTIPQAFHFRKEMGIDGGLYYVFPASATECMDGGSYVKVGVDFPTGAALNKMEDFDYQGSTSVLELMDEWVNQHIPEAGARVNDFCSPYTMTPDSYFVMDRVSDRVTLFSGGSGRAFKFGPLLGDCLAALVNGDKPPVDLTRFSAQREKVTTQKKVLAEVA